MPTPKPQPNSPKKLIRRIRIPKIGPRKTKGLFEEYFYGFLAAIFLCISILLKAGGMATYDSFVVGLWIAGLTWFARQATAYRKERSGPVEVKKVEQPAERPAPTSGKLPPGMKPMIGPQWPIKPGAKPITSMAKPSEALTNASSTVQKPSSPGNSQQPGAPAPASKPVFVYERPTLPDRKPKLPANWRGAQDKKPKK